MSAWQAGWVLGAVLWQAQCGSSTPPPETTYRDFAAASAKGDANTAWSLLSKETQAELDRQAAAVAAVQKSRVPITGKIVAFGDALMSPRKIKSITVQVAGDKRSVLVVTDSSGGTQAIATVLEEGAWRLDLTEELRRSKR